MRSSQVRISLGAVGDAVTATWVQVGAA